ncbi:MAG: thiamine diphosphokinase [Solobacterium sp.]|nr:thiamine diphosphokinase [Solobacterium sp.]
METLILFTKEAPLNFESFETQVAYGGVDYGAYYLATQKKMMEFSIGDFDSVEDTKLIQEMSKDFISLPKEKDSTDLEAAIKEALKRGYEEIWVFGALGERVDHELINLRLAYQYPGIVMLSNEQNRIFALSEGDYEITKDEYSYLSLFTFREAGVSLEGVKYPLVNQELYDNDLYTSSNEIIEDKAVLQVKRGTVLIIQSKDKEKTQ